MITFALSKGRILDDTRPLLRAAGMDVTEDIESSRKLILATQRDDVRILLVRASDVPTYVQYGGADIGISGKDTLMETDTTGLYEPLDLKIATCRLMVAVREDTDYEALVQRGRRLRVATKYIDTARAHFAKKGVHVDLIKLYGSMELAPLVGLADAIVDVVSSGATLKANKLKAVEKIADISARLIVNQAALKTKRDAIMPIIESFAKSIAHKS
jgi:ATP phosphoribosyltransferase